jgi:UDP-N-acetylmuramoyl-tripeptide--D-alanyl-D-alanine ligase
MRPFEWTDRAVREALGLRDAGAPEAWRFSGVSTDTRSLREGELFVALSGPNWDGHAFVAEALGKGAGGIVISDPTAAPSDRPFYLVPDTLVALGALARHRRRALDGVVIAITGSTGKTTVKELLRTALEPDARVHATLENRNNRIGLPQTLLAAPDDVDFVVVELGTSEEGEIGALTAITEPDLGVVTTVTEAHLEGLGSFSGVIREKLALLSGARAGATVLVGDTPPELPEAARAMRPDVHVAGFSERSDPGLHGIRDEPDPGGRVPFRFLEHNVIPGLAGGHGAFNTLLALAVIHLLGRPIGPSVERVRSARPMGMRGELVRIGDLRVIADCYNANPQSTSAALDQLASTGAPAGRVAVLGSMLELGERSGTLHREVLRDALVLPIDRFVLVGEFCRAAEEIGEADDPRVALAKDTVEAATLVSSLLHGEEVVLLKGSRGVALEAVLPVLEERFAGVGRDRGAKGGEGGT